ncbi:ATP-dependent helicase [Candidatus Methylacidithermus pantelleriae]|uniref:DNA 3'-5' helicase n=1 Tax=Candidatus Methylacidithermus pantelleriae TaxID=2744239 RepID=A0A8J2FSD6_9BACT|nr:UvrD-helicase domain-containing protein [Candidatus Methylacidithermus pantelleriae]CAF0695815.1 DNA helicase [Candidatus Methylacidithermus pantelleriae]
MEPPYLSGLNPQQKAAVTAPCGPILVIAGAGSGKTRTLSCRVAYLLDQGIPPDRVLLATFTNKAAREMIDRVTKLVPVDASRIWGGTFHHIGHRLLRRHSERLRIDPHFTIIDREDAEHLLAECCQELGYSRKEGRFIPKAAVLLELFSLSIGTRRTLETVLAERLPEALLVQKEIGEIWEAYRNKKRASRLLDYDDLLWFAFELLRNDSFLREHYQEKFLHILVDEYQDTNRLQSDLVDLLAQRHRNLMVVGDDAQSIYSWRGAEARNILSFPQRYPDAFRISIEVNYRSAPAILELANRAIEQNIRQFPKRLRPAPFAPKGMQPLLVVAHDPTEQAAFVGWQLSKLAEQGIPWHEMAVLYRAHFHSLEVQMELVRLGIDFEVTSGLRFFEQAHIKDIAAFLRLVVNPKDEVAFRRVATLMPGIGPKTAARLWLEVSRGKDLGQIVPPASALPTWTTWYSLHQELLNLVHRPDAQVKLIVERFYDSYARLSYPDAESRLEDVKELANFAKGFKHTEEMLAELSLLTNLEAPRKGEDKSLVRLSTIHQAKGLEWRIVFVIMLCEGLFPAARSLTIPHGEEEERRLFYVAITRAKEGLFLVYPRFRPEVERGKLKPSRFLEELSSKLLETRQAKDFWTGS